VAVGFAGSLLIDRFLPPEWAAQFFGKTAPLDAATQEYWRQGIQLLGNVALGVGWFSFTTLFWRRSPAAHRTEVEAFLVRLDTPIDFIREEGAGAANDARQSSVVGWLCLTYGTFVGLLALVPNPLSGRIAFVFCGGLVVLIGGALVLSSRSVAPLSPVVAPV